jgi:hypothetical protein
MIYFQLIYRVAIHLDPKLLVIMLKVEVFKLYKLRSIFEKCTSKCCYLQ